MKLTQKLMLGAASGLGLSMLPSAAYAADAETAYILNTFLLLISGALVMFMAAGFAMLEAGMVRSKSVAVILTKNIGLYAIAGLMFYLVGYNLMYLDVNGGYLGTFSSWAADDSAALAGDYSAGYSSTADWFFQMVFVATAASIVSGALAERIKLWPFMLFVVVLTGIMYPITGSWQWGGGWLAEAGFADFAGSTLVHSVGGWAALAGAILLGARRDRFPEKGESAPIPGASLPQATLGTFILWLGWFGFNGGSQLALGSAADAVAVANIFANTNVAAAGGVVAVLIISQIISGRIDLPMALNGALAGLVAITAAPDTPTLLQAIMIGAIGGAVMMAAASLLETLKIDDVVGAVPVHLAAGIWGTLAVPLTNPEASFGTQLTGVVSVGAFIFIASLIIWSVLKATVGIRLHWRKEDMGGDLSELGVSAYNLHFGSESSENIKIQDGKAPAAANTSSKAKAKKPANSKKKSTAKKKSTKKKAA